ncbi:MAG: hypothetical protein HY779_04980 [Rubrobacteridae bacterium]|nr:hypothetical protein [Rubrobacteridae bacterium]
MAEKRREARAVSEGEQRMAQGEEMMGRTETMGGGVTPMTRAAVTPAWYSRISWGSILAGVLVAIASQLILSSIGVLVGFGITSVTSIQELTDVVTGVGIWTAVSALIASFIGGFVASRLASVQFSSDGLWHGLTVWSLILVSSILLSTIGVSGLLGFAGNAITVLRGIIPTGAVVSPDDIAAARDIATTSSLYFLIGSLAGLAAALLGGWLGSQRKSRRESMRTGTTSERMAA